MIDLHKYQRKVIESSARFILASAGWQGGKTTVGAVKLMVCIDRDTKEWYKRGKRPFERPTYWIVAPSDEILRNYSMQKFMDVLPDGSYDWSESKKTVTIKASGVTIIGKSAHRPQSIEAATLNGIWADEPGLYKREVWNKLRPRINIRNGFILFTTTPYALSWLYDEVYLKWLEGDKDFDVIQWRSIDNPYFDKEEYYKEMKRLPKEEFEMKYGGKFTKLTGMVYDFNKYKHVIPLSMIPRLYNIVIGGIDFGIAKPAGISVVGIANGTYYVLDEVKRAGMEWEELANAIKRLEGKYHVSFWYADPEDPKAISFLRTQGIVVSEARRDVQERLRAVRVVMGDGKFFVSERCEETVKEFQTYSRKVDKDGLYSEDPVDRNDHLMDAMGYAIQCHHYSDIDNLHKTILNLSDVTKPHYITHDDLSVLFTPKGREDMYKLTYGEEALDLFYKRQQEGFENYEEPFY